MCVRDSCVYELDALCCLIHESYVRSVGRYSFVRNYVAIPVQLEVILQYVGWCVRVVWTLLAINAVASDSFCWLTFATPSCLFTYSVGANCSHAVVMCWIVSGSFPHLLHSSLIIIIIIIITLLLYKYTGKIIRILNTFFILCITVHVASMQT